MDQEKEPRKITSREYFTERIVENLTGSVLRGEPFEFSNQDILVLRQALVEKGANLEINEKEKDSLENGTQLKLKPGSEPGKMQFYVPGVNEDASWVEVSSLEELPEDFWIRTGDKPDQIFKDRSLGLIAVLGFERTAKLVTESLDEAKELKWTHTTSKIKDEETQKVVGIVVHTDTEGRGLQQAIADIVAVAVAGENSKTEEPRVVKQKNRLNKRVWKSLVKTWKKNKREDMIEITNKNFTDAGVEPPGKTTMSMPLQNLPELVWEMLD